MIDGIKLTPYNTFIIGLTILAIYKIVCFIVGYCIVRLGYKLINDGVKGEFNFTSEFKGIKGGLVSSSPGLLFVLLGTFIICFAVFSKNPLDITEEGKYGETVNTVPATKDDISAAIDSLNNSPNDTLVIY